MTHASTEFLVHTNGFTVLCADIQHINGGKYKLPRNHTRHDFDQFVKSLDFEYDSGYGLQYLYGTIWYTDGTWSTRGEYDGSEWWERHVCPLIPDDL